MDLVEKLAKSVLSQINVENIVSVLRDLISISGHRELPEKESKVAEYIFAWFEKVGIDAEKVDVTPGRPNVIAVIKGANDGYSLMYNCHMDTVPEYGWTGKPCPFDAEVKEGRVYGRGSCDMKGAIAAIMIAMKAIQRSKIELKGDLIFAGVVGEEGDGSIGTKDLMQKKFMPDMAVVCEPTDLNISIGHRGSSNLMLSVHGRPAHSAYPERGVNAIMLTSDVLQELKKELFPKLKQRKHNLLGSPTLTPAVIQGGIRTDVVPDLCKVTLNYRYPPGEEPEKVKDEISNLLKKLREKNPNLNAEVTILSNALGVETSRDHVVINTLRRNVKKLAGENPKIIGSGFWTDASILVNQGRIPSVIFGPGKEEIAHTIMEYVEIDQLLIAAQVYALTALDICSKQRVQGFK
jgi:acetylornithine deacetylase/succinyl-diaminopimelate desuccinylase